jgi:hypothetical protein
MENLSEEVARLITGGLVLLLSLSLSLLTSSFLITNHNWNAANYDQQLSESQGSSIHRVEGIKIESSMRKSISQHHLYRLAPQTDRLPRSCPHFEHPWHFIFVPRSNRYTPTLELVQNFLVTMPTKYAMKICMSALRI